MSRSRRRRKHVVAKGVRVATPEEPVASQEQRDRCGDEATRRSDCTGTFLNSACVPGRDGGHAHQLLIKDLFCGPSLAGEMVLVHCGSDSGDDPESWAVGDVVSFRMEEDGEAGRRIIPGSLRLAQQLPGLRDASEAFQEKADGQVCCRRVSGFMSSLWRAAAGWWAWFRGEA